MDVTTTQVAIRLLGPVAVLADGAPRPVQGLRRNAVLAALALQAGQTVSMDRLVDIVWGNAAPRTATDTLRNHVSYLRRTLRDRAKIVARSAGYVLKLADTTTDVEAAERLIGRADHCFDARQRQALLRAAIGHWAGPPLEDLTELAWFGIEAQRLDRLQLHAQQLLIDTCLQLGEHHQVLPELEQLTRQHPLNEHLHRQLMTALYRCGRQADALAAFQRLRQVLGGELGIDPDPGLRDLEAAILRQDPDLAAPPTPPASADGRLLITPAQLPPTIATFTGRASELALLHSLLPPAPIRLPTPTDDAARVEATRLVVVSGTAGVGKTVLATHWAQQVRECFPDGQLHVNLRGFDPSGVAMEPAEAVRGFLDALGVPPDQIPASAQAQASLYRSVLSDKRVLVVIDNARDEQQVRLLLPGAPGCMVLVTSRDQLPGLVAADGAQPMALDRPSVTEARQILAGRLGARRVEAEPRAVDDIIAQCARLPLALAIIAAHGALAPALPLADLAAQLRDTAATLEPFSGADPATSIRAVFSWSYHTLSDPAARLFRLLGPCPGPDVALPAAASVAGLPTCEVRPLLAELTRAHLITEASPGRFGFHELLRAYAIEQAQLRDTVAQRAAARHRFLDHHLHTAHAASLLLKPGRTPIDLIPPGPEITPRQLADRDAALAWLTAERSVLLATMARQPDGYDQHTWQLAWELLALLTTRGDWLDNEAVQLAGLRAARRLGDRVALAHAHRGLGKVYGDLGRLDEAQQHTEAALSLFEQIDNPVAIVDIRLNLGIIAGRRGDFRQAIAHAERAHSSYRCLGHRAGQAYAAHNVAWCHRQLGDYQAALPYCQEALDILIDIGDLEASANVSDNLGELYSAMADHLRAEHCFQQAISLYRKLGDRFREAEVHTSLGDCYGQAGDRRAARRAWRQALAVLGDLEPDTAAKIRTRLAPRTRVVTARDRTTDGIATPKARSDGSRRRT